MNINYNTVRFIATILFFCAVSVIIASCNKYNESVSPALNYMSAEMQEDNARINSACDPFTTSTQNTIQRNKVVSLYGLAGGTRYDQVKASYVSNPNQYVNTYTRIYAYKNQIQNAIISGAANYASKFCNEGIACLGQYSGAELKSKISLFLNPIITNIQNDGQLTDLDKNILNSIIQAYNDNFDNVFDNYANAGYDCFPNPGWYPSGVVKGGMKNVALFGWSKLGKIIKKIVNIAATILTELVEGAVYGSVQGALVGVLVGNPLAGWVVGAVIGAGIGIVNGVNRSMSGGYVCLIGPCN
jgi:hypothetical protein